MIRLEFLPGQNFECTGCARCCRGWNVHVDPRTRAGLEGQPLLDQVAAEIGRPALEEAGDGTVITAMVDGQCAFLDGQDRCRIHASIAREAKPLGCRQFPFLIRPTRDGVQVSISFSCTSARENSGRPLAEYEGEIRDLLEQWNFKTVGLEPVRVAGDASISWDEYGDLEAMLLEGLDRLPPMLAVGRGLVAACRFLSGGGSWAEALGAAREGPFPRDPVIASMEGFFLASLAGTLEGEGETAREVTEAMLQGGRLRLARLGWEGEAADLARYSWGMRLEWLDPEMVRYLKALLFVKFPALDRTLLDNLALLYLLPPLLRWYTCAYAFVRGAAAPEREDWYAALDVAERELITHGRGLDRLFEAFGQAFRQQVAG